MEKIINKKRFKKILTKRRDSHSGRDSHRQERFKKIFIKTRDSKRCSQKEEILRDRTDFKKIYTKRKDSRR